MVIRKVFCLLFFCQLVLVSRCQGQAPGKRNAMNVIEVKVVEENEGESEVFDLAEYRRRSSQSQPPSVSKPEVKLSSPNQEWSRLFRFDRESQKLFAVQRLDRESLCQSSFVKCYVQLELAVVGLETLRLNVEIVDTNDHAPAFAESSHRLHVSELSQPEIIFHLKPAADLDYGRNAEVTFTLQPPDTPFRLEVERNSLDEIVDLRLGLAGELDRETKSKYRLLVVATDSGQPMPLSGSTVIDVVVDDENDNQPIFERSRYSAEVRPDDPVGHTVLTVRATDRDEGQNGRVRYYFPKKTSAVYGSLFSIDAVGGEIKLVSSVADHRQLGSSFKLVVFAEDHGPNAIPTSTTVVVRVVNTNVHPPVISVQSTYVGSDPLNLIVEENNAADFVLAKISAHDQDPGEGGLVDCRVRSDGPAFYLARLDSNDFQLIVREPLDREREGLHEIDVDCEDMGTPALSSSVRLSLVVVDVDDNPPRFSRPLYTATVRENNEPGAVVLSLEVEDLDVDPANGQNDFFVEPHFEHLFAVDAAGRLVALISLDREQSDRYGFHVFAKGGKLPGDNSTYRHVAKTSVVVLVLDADDELPRFEQPWFKFEVAENMPAGTIVGKVKAVDPDLPPNNDFRYSLESPTTAAAASSSDLPFSIDPQTGVIFSKVPLDRELQGRYEFNVYAKNDSANVFVDVTDANDNPPVWLHPKPDSCQRGGVSQLRVKGNLTFGQSLDALTASDADSDPNSAVAYAILSGNEMNQFSLESKTGTLSWNSYLSGPMLHQQHQQQHLQHHQQKQYQQQQQQQQQQQHHHQPSNPCQIRLSFVAEDSGKPALKSQAACLEVIFEECLQHVSGPPSSPPLPPPQPSPGESKQDQQARGSFSDLYIIIIVAVLIVCMIIAVILTAFICITRQQTKAMKRREEFRRGDLRASLPLNGPDNEAVLVLDRSSTNESSDQLTGILVSLRSAEQLGRLQLRSLAPSKDSLMSTSISLHRERDADSGYADVSPV